MSIFSRVGIPREIISGHGTQFTSDLMGKVHKLVGIKPIFTTLYYPMMNGKLERQHATLKSKLYKNYVPRNRKTGTVIIFSPSSQCEKFSDYDLVCLVYFFYKIRGRTNCPPLII